MNMSCFSLPIWRILIVVRSSGAWWPIFRLQGWRMGTHLKDTEKLLPGCWITISIIIVFLFFWVKPNSVNSGRASHWQSVTIKPCSFLAKLCSCFCGLCPISSASGNSCFFKISVVDWTRMEQQEISKKDFKTPDTRAGPETEKWENLNGTKFFCCL